MNDRELLRECITFLGRWPAYWDSRVEADKLISRLRTALAAPEHVAPQGLQAADSPQEVAVKGPAGAAPPSVSPQAPTAERDDFPWLPVDLHPATKNLVVQFAGALADKLYAAEKKYGYSDGWMADDWLDECRAKLREHVTKGDPRDVAAYCAFLWYHKASTAIGQGGTAEGADWVRLATGLVELADRIKQQRFSAQNCCDEALLRDAAAMLSAAPRPDAQREAYAKDYSKEVDAMRAQGTYRDTVATRPDARKGLAKRFLDSAKRLSALISIQPSNFSVVNDLQEAEWALREAARALGREEKA